MSHCNNQQTCFCHEAQACGYVTISNLRTRSFLVGIPSSHKIQAKKENTPNQINNYGNGHTVGPPENPHDTVHSSPITLENQLFIQTKHLAETTPL